MTTLENNAAVSVTTGPITGSRKVYHQTESGLRVPARRIDLSNGEHFDVYDTSGPYTDPEADIDVHSGLHRLRAGWADGREHNTQLG
ncbi:MAG TPA: phosphomethylpyrimidine synthase, partial [Amycolatopsis sp.]